jgi:hypothetical protein
MCIELKTAMSNLTCPAMPCRATLVYPEKRWAVDSLAVRPAPPDVLSELQIHNSDVSIPNRLGGELLCPFCHHATVPLLPPYPFCSCPFSLYDSSSLGVCFGL